MHWVSFCIGAMVGVTGAIVVWWMDIGPRPRNCEPERQA